MTAITERDLSKAIRRAAVRATLAPSVHNTQPWRLVVGADSIELYADRSRQLHVLDPHGRQLLISCGCALFNIRVAMAAAGVGIRVERLPDPADPSLLARITLNSTVEPEHDLAVLDDAVDERRTNRRRFFDDPVPADFVDALVDAANREATDAFVVKRPEDRIAVATLSQRADNIENADPAYRAELRAWTSDDPTRADGVPAFAVPHVDAGAEDDIPIRDFDTRGMGWLPTQTRSSMDQCLVLIGSMTEGPMAWLRTGEGLERMLLEVTRNGYAASPLTQVIEVTHTNELLRNELRLTMHPHVLLRIGRAPATPKTRRRRLVDVITDAK